MRKNPLKLCCLKEHSVASETCNLILWFLVQDNANILPTVHCFLGVGWTVVLRDHKFVMFESFSSERADDAPDNSSKGTRYCCFSLRWVLSGPWSVFISLFFSFSVFCLSISKPLVSDVITCYSIILHDYISSWKT